MSAGATEEYKVRLDVFEGPLDLLLYLIKKDEVDVYDIPIERITTQYMEYLDVLRMLDLNIAGDFLVMAATLMMIKSRLLLPVEERSEEMEEEEEDPRWDLVKQLVAYKKFKDAAMHLEDLEMDRLDVIDREGEHLALNADADSALHEVSIFDLITAFNDALARAPEENLSEIFSERYTVADQVDYILDLLKRKKRVTISKFFAGMKSRHEIVCTFLAMLELIKLNQLCATQKDAFGNIEIERAEAVTGEEDNDE